MRPLWTCRSGSATAAGHSPNLQAIKIYRSYQPFVIAFSHNLQSTKKLKLTFVPRLCRRNLAREFELHSTQTTVLPLHVSLLSSCLPSLLTTVA